MIEALCKPQYVFRPSQIIRRMLRIARPLKPQELIRLPWGLEIEVDTADNVGSAIALQGVYDLVTTEVLWRITAAGDRTIDGGANVGYMSSILAFRAGRCGNLLAFEPHPGNFERLSVNAQRWSSSPIVAPIDLHKMALSNRLRRDTLLDVPSHQENTSWMHLQGWDHQSEALRPGIMVEVRRLDEFINSEIGVMKLDVEFHEAQVLEGAGKLLSNVRDVVFEETSPYPQKSHEILERAGFRIVGFEEHLSGPRMIDPATQAKRRSYDTASSYLATQDFARAEQLLSLPGWQSLKYSKT